MPEAALGESDLLAMVETNTGVHPHMLRTALDYWAAYPAEVDVMVEEAERAEQQAVRNNARTQSLLRP